MWDAPIWCFVQLLISDKRTWKKDIGVWTTSSLKSVFKYTTKLPRNSVCSDEFSVSWGRRLSTSSWENTCGPSWSIPLKLGHHGNEKKQLFQRIYHWPTKSVIGSHTETYRQLNSILDLILLMTYNTFQIIRKSQIFNPDRDVSHAKIGSRESAIKSLQLTPSFLCVAFVWNSLDLRIIEFAHYDHTRNHKLSIAWNWPSLHMIRGTILHLSYDECSVCPETLDSSIVLRVWDNLSRCQHEKWYRTRGPVNIPPERTVASRSV